MDSVAIVVVDRSGTIRFWSPGAETLFGHPVSGAVGATLDLIVPPHLRDRHWSGFHRAWEEGLSDDVRVALIPVACADGETHLFPGRFLPIRAPHGDLAALMGVWQAPSGRDDGMFVLG
ncbi:MAG TPA: PAS domain-containing protein [Acidimicrobiales bacterium]|nr:PAS domain-containing protein [Acidimicrobiales bacterium]